MSHFEPDTQAPPAACVICHVVKTAAGRSMSTETVAFATVGTIVGRGGGIIVCERHRSLLDEVVSADGYALLAKVITGGGA